MQLCTKSFVGWGFAPDPLGSLHRSPDLLASLGVGPTGNGKEDGEGREGRDGKGGASRNAQIQSWQAYPAISHLLT